MNSSNSCCLAVSIGRHSPVRTNGERVGNKACAGQAPARAQLPLRRDPRLGGRDRLSLRLTFISARIAARNCCAYSCDTAAAARSASWLIRAGWSSALPGMILFTLTTKKPRPAGPATIAALPCASVNSTLQRRRDLALARRRSGCGARRRARPAARATPASLDRLRQAAFRVPPWRRSRRRLPRRAVSACSSIQSARDPSRMLASGAGAAGTTCAGETSA